MLAARAASTAAPSESKVERRDLHRRYHERGELGANRDDRYGGGDWDSQPKESSGKHHEHRERLDRNDIDRLSEMLFASSETRQLQ